jgi:hypothetical protein
LALALVVIFATQRSPFVQGVFVGAVVVFWIGLVWVGVLIGSGQLRHFWGRSGERATAQELASKRLRRAGWSVAHGLVVRGHEIDHVAVGPGGVIAIETKWVTGERWTVERGTLRGPIRDPILQVRRSAARVGELLRSSTGGRHDVDVIPVLMVWGPGSPVVSPETREVGGVPIFTGRTIDDFRSWLSQDRLERSKAEAIASDLAAFADVQQQAARLGERGAWSAPN